MSESIFRDPRDNSEYKTVRLRDGKRWFAQNLRFQCAGSCDALPEDASGWEKYASTYDPVSYGRLYHFKAAASACPPGWRLPTYRDWTTMLKRYGPIETREWMGSSRLQSDTTKRLNEDGFGIICGATGRGSFDAANPGASSGAPYYHQSTMWAKYWVHDCPPGLLLQLVGRTRPAPFVIGDGESRGEGAYFVCLADNAYLHSESLAFWYSVRCIEN
jgi:uncharacterized protein (TIGR02145 family)